MSYLAEAGHVYEAVRSHYAIALDGDLVILNEGEILILVRADVFQAEALRVDTNELVHVTLLEVAGVEGQTYRRLWP